MIVRNKTYAGVLIAVAIGVLCSPFTVYTAPQDGASQFGSRPAGLLGRSVNTPQDDFAPGTTTTHGNSTLTFTSKVDGREVLKVVGMEYLPSDDTTAAKIDTVWALPPYLVRNTGTASGVDATKRGSTVFAVSAAPGKRLSAVLNTAGSIHGGSDLFEISSAGVVRSLDAVNSEAWDAHPAIARHGNMEILIFSSDRYSGNTGYSAPYQGVTHTTPGGRAIVGNADLWVSFRSVTDSVWSKPVNLSGFGPAKTINSDSNEYSPFIFCADYTPHLLFASNRGGSYDIYDAELKIDWVAKNVTVKSVTRLSNTPSEINTDFAELFPFVPYPHKTSQTQDLFFSSDRFSATKPEAAKAQGFGGLDIYRLKVNLLCEEPPVQIVKEEPPKIEKPPVQEPPKPLPGNITYTVTLINREKKDMSVQQGAISLKVDNRMIADSVCSKRTYKIPSSSLRIGQEVSISAFGKSSFFAQPCKETLPIITGYTGEFVTATPLPDTKRREQYMKDTVIQNPPIKVRRIVPHRDTLAVYQTTLPAKYKNKSYQIEITDQRRLVIVTDSLTFVDSLPPPTHTKVKRWRDVIVKNASYDTTIVSASEQRIPSAGSAKKPITIVVSEKDVVINDTIFMDPVYDIAPLCVEVFQGPDSTENVPYFQTAFWEVNTTAGYHRHMNRLRRGDLKGSPWIELHYRNSYWGGSDPTAVSPRLERRREEYRVKAKLIDRNIDSLCTRAGITLRKFWNADSVNPNAKLLISMQAFSDYRPIRTGSFISDSAVSYISTTYNESTNQIEPARLVQIKPGASLVGEDNDTLSKLRAYYGYQEVYKVLEQDSLFKELRRKGLVLTPTDVTDGRKFDARIAQARVIVLAEGKYVDESVIPKYKAYGVDADNDYRRLDWVRRVDVQVRMANLRGTKWERPDCCR
ncbi:MAG: hypothetical protein D8M52_08830 [Chlorobi bacterium]|nr:MAG: hypothetical protein F9K28_10135 [Bacteroidota bacterium]MBE2266295.1 hypothetical protein [Flavobacteriales bacterium]MBL1161806.1 hypothetical protein [Chlorobiota bacterium]MBW7853472.1 hypothetical protein [Candidatus Kapabacteria bacterium]MCC6331605.1 hypothetical protein [Ignavibacteria bacterium]